jgi:uncharacterized ferritin-like protein (DUF455 family)
MQKLEVVIAGDVYDLTSFADAHPGGLQILLKYSGRRDATAAFDEAMHSDRALNMMRDYKVGETGEVKYEPHRTFDIPITPNHPTSLVDFALRILNTQNSSEKADLTIQAYQLYSKGLLPNRHGSEAAPPELSARDAHLVYEERANMSEATQRISRQISLIHSQAHIESYAIDLSWDIIARFHSFVPALPDSFFADWLAVALDEAKHFRIWRNRLLDLDSFYGQVPVHTGLWDSARDTKDSLLARLAIVHMVHEARGLDTAPTLRQKFMSAGDVKSANFMTEIERDELTHVRAGMRWFLHLCTISEPALEPVPTYHSLVKQFFQGSLRPPFATEARASVGMSEDWYLPLVNDKFLKDQQTKLARQAAQQEQSRIRIQKKKTSQLLAQKEVEMKRQQKRQKDTATTFQQ